MVSFPIAVLDTGAGGLSVLKAIRYHLPHEDIFYFADTAHLPYGIKSPELIKFLALKMARKIKEISSCKVLVIACHTISVSCLLDIEKELSIPVMGMLKPSLLGLRKLAQDHSLMKFGVLSTRATFDSGVYRKAWASVEQQKVFVEQACGPLVSLVEDADVNIKELASILAGLLSDDIKSCDALLLGCTHFSALYSSLSQVLKPGCRIIDAAYYAAQFLVDSFPELFQNNKSDRGRVIAHVTDNPERFKKISRRFIEEELTVELIANYVTS